MKLKDKHSEQDIAAISNTITQARVTRTGLPEFPGELPKTLETAYKIQDCSIAHWDDKIVGWKVGGIPTHLQDTFKCDRLSGPIYASSVKNYLAGGITQMPVFKNGFAAIEAEYIIQLKDVSELPASGLNEQQIIDSIDKIYIGAEIASSPIQNINDFGPVAPISDFGNNAGMIIGPEIENWQAIDLSAIDVTVVIDGQTHGPTTTQANLAGPYGAAKFLIEQLKTRGYTIEPGTYISSGAITGVHDSSVGSTSTVTFEGLGSFDLSLISNDLVAND